MAKSEQPESLPELSDVEHVRKRPGMYIGGTKFFGFIQYLVSAFDLLLAQGATWLEFEIADHFRLSSDARVPVHVNAGGLVVPFEAFGDLEPRHLADATVLMALSSELRAAINDGESQWVLVSKNGARQTFQTGPSATSLSGTTLEFSPDPSIFSVTKVSPAVAHSYCKRTACLHPGVAIRIKVGREVTEYKSTNGIRDFFDAVTTPYQLLHNPIHIHESQGDLDVETVFVFHSWEENQIWSFANKGRVPDGGTHEAGLLDAIAQLHNRQAATGTRRRARRTFVVGVLAVLAIKYPSVAYEGCIKARIGNPELRERVRELVAAGLDRWVRENPEEVEYLKTIERFQFAAVW